jgi:hypothetical protein
VVTARDEKGCAVTWSEQAAQLAEGAAELGVAAATINAATWAARVDPSATSGLVGAAMALDAPLHMLWPSGPALPSDTALVSHASDMETAAGDLLGQARRLFDGAAQAHEAACEAAKAAAAASSAAKTGEESAAAASAMAEAQRQIADCECALELLSDLGPRIQRALACFARVPDDLAETYEAAYRLVRKGRKLPAHGDFLTGTDPRRAA